MQEVSVTHQPILVAVNSQHATNPNPSNSDLTFGLPDEIRTPSSNAVALISLKSFNTVNSFWNITNAFQNNTLVVLVNYYNTVSKSNGSYTTTIVVPDGYYDVNSLLLYLNTQMAAINTTSLMNTLSANVFGGTNATTQPAFTWTQYGNIVTNVYSATLNQSTTSTTNTVQYLNFMLVNNSASEGLLQTMGFIYKTTQPTSSQSIPMVTCQASYNDTASTCTYTFNSTYNTISSSTTGVYGFPCLYYLDLLEVTNLFIVVDNTISQHRNSYSGLRQTDFILGIPVSVPFGSTLTYVDTGVKVLSYNTNLSLTTLHITIYDQLGRAVNFRGTPWSCQILFEFSENDDNTQRGNANEMNMSHIPPVNPSNLARPYESSDRDLLYPKNLGNPQQLNRSSTDHGGKRMRF